MELTGITRRIDQLGRIVIPKEIRASLRIKNGDELEIYTKENDIILKKNSSLNKLTDIGNIIVSSLNYYLKFNVFLTDKDKYISISGSLKNKYLNKEIDDAEFRAIRVQFGIYEERNNLGFMIRAKVNSGIITD